MNPQSLEKMKPVIEDNGFAIVPAVIEEKTVRDLVDGISTALDDADIRRTGRSGYSLRHRRVIHLEFAAEPLPNGLTWAL